MAYGYPACERDSEQPHPRGQKETNTAKKVMACFAHWNDNAALIKIAVSLASNTEEYGRPREPLARGAAQPSRIWRADWSICSDAASLRAHRKGQPEHFPGSDHWRDRNRKGTGCTSHTLQGITTREGVCAC